MIAVEGLGELRANDAVSAVWGGPERNAHLNGPLLIVTRTDGAMPFRLFTHIGDVGHTLIVG